ncbi:MAG TPA: hypothetical protein VHU44_14115 [Acidobacteriaceae bacterium]|jgi:hypothetical protein|nr:hypothetical protein [Acidobacteriaceae bacterium]
MNDLNKALTDLSHIRRQMARTTEFRGYGPATLAATGVIALIAAAVQATWVPDPAHNVRDYLAVWFATAVVCGGVIAVQMYTRARRMHSAMADEMIQMAVEQFFPALVAGLLVTMVLAHFVPSALWMLPALWQLVYSLGVFSSCRFLPRPVMLGGGWYLLTSMVCLAFGDARALSPWTMGLAYGAGQMLIAAALYAGAEVASDEE